MSPDSSAATNGDFLHDDAAAPPKVIGGAEDNGLFALPSGARQPLARVVLITGAPGSGKTRLAKELALPTINLDDFYRDGDYPGLPRRHGMVDWDSPKCWDDGAAMAAIMELATTGKTQVPVYSIPQNRRIGERELTLGTSGVIVAEGIFAARIVERCRREGILGDAICIWRPSPQIFWFRLMRDLDEARKPPLNLIRRGIANTLAEPGMYKRAQAAGCRKMTVPEAARQVRELAARWSRA